jgi:hypothetical protein
MTMTNPIHLKPKTAPIIFGFVALAFIAVCVRVVGWPLVVGMVIAIFLFPIVYWLVDCAVVVIFAFAGFVLRRIFSLRFRVFATQPNLHPTTLANH